MTDKKKFGGFTIIEILIVLAIVSIVAATVYGAISDAKEWREFSEANNCKSVTGMIRQGDTYTYYMMVGNVMMPMTGRRPDRQGYQCDDGQSHWR